MNTLGYYAKKKGTNDLFQFEHGAGDEFYIVTPMGKLHSDPNDYEILEIGFFSDRTNGLTEVQLQRRLVLLNQLAKAINDDLAKMGYADEDGFVNTCSVAEKDGDGSLGANVVNMFLLADPNNAYAEEEMKTDAEYEALKPKPKVRAWETINTECEINEDFLPNSNLTYTILFDGVDRFKALLEDYNFERRLVGVENAPKVLYYTLTKQIEDLTPSEVEQVLSYSGLDSEEEIDIRDIFMEKSFIKFQGVRVKIEMDVIDIAEFAVGESAEDYLNRLGDIYLHDSGEEGYQNKKDLGGNTKIKFVSENNS